MVRGPDLPEPSLEDAFIALVARDQPSRDQPSRDHPTLDHPTFDHPTLDHPPGERAA